MKHVIEIQDDKPFPKKRKNTVDTHGTAVVKTTDDDGKVVEVTEYGIVRNEDIYKLIKEGKEIIIFNCFVKDLSLKDYQKKGYCEKDAEITIKGFVAESSFFNGNTDFSSGLFSKRNNFKRAQFSGKAIFNLVQFIGDVHFNGTRFWGDTFFESAHFNGKDTTFIQTQFSKRVNFNSAQFNKGVRFNSAQFGEGVDFKDSEFTGEAKFGDAKFKGKANFSKVQFSGHADFSESKYWRDATFSETKFNRSIDFFNAKFGGNANFHSAIFKANSNWQKTEFKSSTYFINSFFEFPVDFSDIPFQDLDLKGVVFEKYALFQDCTIENGSKETFRIIKDQFMKANNKIDALEYHKKEMEAFRFELKRKKLNWKKILDTIVLWFNKITNDYGSDWVRPILLTLIIGFGLFIWLNYSVDITWNDINFGKFAEFLNPGHKYDFIVSSCKLNYCSYLIDTISRILIGLGYFQIIQAFRKFKIW